MKFGVDGSTLKCGKRGTHGGKKRKWEGDSGFFMFRQAVPSKVVEKCVSSVENFGVPVAWGDVVADPQMGLDGDAGLQCYKKVLFVDGDDGYAEVRENPNSLFLDGVFLICMTSGICENSNFKTIYKWPFIMTFQKG